MKSIRNIAFSVLLTLGAFSAVTYTSCNKDECKDVVCNNGGTCNETDGSCTCPTGYEGTNCDNLTRDKFVGTWTGSDACVTNGQNNTYNITMTINKSTQAIQALINNPGGFGTAITINGVVTATDKLSFTTQSVGGNGRILNGTMTLTSANNLKFEYTVTETGGTSSTCTGNYAKQ